MLRTPVLRAFSSRNGALGLSRRTMGAGFQRTFTSTAQRNADIVDFNPSSSKELDDVLAEIRYKIILPSYLPQEQLKKIHSPDWEKRLQSDPIIIEIDGEVFKFRHMNPLKGDIPSGKKSLNKALKLFKTSQDYENLMPLLEGYYHAKRKIAPEFLSKMIRKTTEKGMIQHVIDCARRVERTNFKLKSLLLVNDLLVPIQMAAARADFSHARTTSALYSVRQVVDILQDEKHQVQGKDQLPLEFHPMVLLPELHLTATLARRDQELGSEHTDAAAAGVVKTVTLARRVLEAWPRDQSLRHERIGGQESHLKHNRKYLSVAAPLLRGLREAIAVIEPIDKELAAELKTREVSLTTELEPIAAQAKAGAVNGVNRHTLGVPQWELCIEKK